MAIPQTAYVNITSGEGAATAVPVRQLIARLMTDNILVPPQTQKTFSGGDWLQQVEDYFGSGSNEYLRAEYYGSWVSKDVQQAPGISFGRWVDTAVPGYIFGAQQTFTLATLTAVTSGHLNLTIGETTHELTGINLSAAGSLAAVATDITTAIQAYSAGGTDWTSAVVSYVAAPTQGGLPQFVLTGGVTGAEAIGIAAAASGTDLGPLLGLLSATAIIAQGSAVETITTTLNNTANASNNFGSLLFLPALNTSQITQFAEWVNSQNVLYMGMVPVTAANAATIEAAISVYGGMAMTLSPLADDYPEMIPMAVLAATNYNDANSVQNYMFQTNFPSTPSVADANDKATYDNLGVNYYGQTQSAGDLINFYQTGVLTGPTSLPTDQNTYANEMWLKDASAAALLTLLLSLAEVSADAEGVSQILAILGGVIQQALSNGTIVIRGLANPFDVDEQLYIQQITNSPTAAAKVQTGGYWVTCVIVPEVVDGVTKYFANYTLVYAQDNVIRFIQGNDVLV
jgi:hypothetical protein